MTTARRPANRIGRASLVGALGLLALLAAACGSDGSELDDLADPVDETVPAEGSTETTVALGWETETGAEVELSPGPCGLVTIDQVTVAVGPIVGGQGLEEAETCTWTAQWGGFLELLTFEGTERCEDVRDAWSLTDAEAVTVEGNEGWGVESDTSTAVLVCGEAGVVGVRIVAPGENTVLQFDLEDLTATAIQNL